MIEKKRKRRERKLKLEIIYNRIKDNIGNKENLEKLLEDIKQAMREEVSLKHNSRARVNGIKRVASKLDIRPVLQGFGDIGEFKVVTDSYHAIFIKEDNMPLENKTEGYPNMEFVMNYERIDKGSIYESNESNEIKLNLKNILTHAKINNTIKKAEENLIEIGKYYYNVRYIKNIIDVLGVESLKAWEQSVSYKGLYFDNDKGEIGLVLPVRKYN